VLVIFYGCETWSVLLKERHTLHIFEIRAKRKIFRAKRDKEMRGTERNLRNAVS